MNRFLRAADATRGVEEWPSRLGTDFEFDVGFSFTFGSVTNNVVNRGWARTGAGGSSGRE